MNQRFLNLPPWQTLCSPMVNLTQHSLLNAAFAEAVHWKMNLFKVPYEKAGKSFVSELARLFKGFATSSALESVALKAATLMPIPLLQKPAHKSKAKDHITCLERRLDTWREGDLNELLREGRTIQQCISKTSPSFKKFVHCFSTMNKLLAHLLI